MDQPQVTNVEELEQLIARVRKAQEEFATFSQEKVDAIFKQIKFLI